MKSITMTAFENSSEQLDHFFNAFHQEKFHNLHCSPASWEGVPSESVNAIDQICHVRDVEIDGYHVRFKRMLNEIEPTLVSASIALYGKWSSNESDSISNRW